MDTITFLMSFALGVGMMGLFVELIRRWPLPPSPDDLLSEHLTFRKRCNGTIVDGMSRRMLGDMLCVFETELVLVAGCTYRLPLARATTVRVKRYLINRGVRIEHEITDMPAEITLFVRDPDKMAATIEAVVAKAILRATQSA